MVEADNVPRPEESAIDSTARRAAGLGLVIASVLAVTVIGATRRTVVGTATAPPVPPAPVIGDCLLTAPTGVGWDDDPSFGLPGPEVPPATAEMGPCQGIRFAEVVTVGVAAGTVDGQLSRWTECDLAAADYLGGPARPPSPTAWQPIFYTWSGFVWPSRRQAAAGQTWVACVVGAGPEDSVSARTGPVDFPLRAAWSRSQVRDRIGICQLDQQQPVPCGGPHRIEALAVADPTVSAATQAELEEGCHDQVAEQTGMADITAGGTLTPVTVVGAYRPGAPDDEIVADVETARSLTPAPAYVYAVCTIGPTAPDRMLTGSLRSLGDAPVPFSR